MNLPTQMLLHQTITNNGRRAAERKEECARVVVEYTHDADDLASQREFAECFRLLDPSKGGSPELQLIAIALFAAFVVGGLLWTILPRACR